MGVKGLWELLAPCGRRVSIETLDGKVVAVDASIWITQFVKAMRDDEGNMIKNAHLIGTMKRILKLLFHRIRPVFVFDGATPLLKIQTVKARRSIREKQEVSKRTTAQRIYLSQLKQQAIQDKLKKSMPPKTNDAENYASTFTPGPSQTKQQKLQEQQQRELIWPSSRSMVQVQLDDDTVIIGRVIADGVPADALRSIGLIGIETNDGHSIEVPYPNENITVIDEKVTSNICDSSIIEKASSSSSSTINLLENNPENIKTNPKSFGVNVLGSQNEVISMSQWPSDINESEWLNRSQTLIGKRLSKNTGRIKGYEDLDLMEGGDVGIVDEADEDDNDDEVQWVDGHENLRVKKKRKKRDDDNDDNDDYSDDESDEDVHWQTPNDSADINIEVLASLPPHLRKNMIEDLRKKERKRSRSTFMPVASNPTLYSQTQLANFLSGSKLNKRISEVQKHVDGKEEGRKIVGEEGRTYVLTGPSDANLSGSGGFSMDDEDITINASISRKRVIIDEEDEGDNRDGKRNRDTNRSNRGGGGGFFTEEDPGQENQWEETLNDLTYDVPLSGPSSSSSSSSFSSSSASSSSTSSSSLSAIMEIPTKQSKSVSFGVSKLYENRKESIHDNTINNSRNSNCRTSFIPSEILSTFEPSQSTSGLGITKETDKAMVIDDDDDDVAWESDSADGNKDDDKKDDERENDLDGEAHFRDNLRDAQLLSDLSAENDPGNSLQKALVLSPSKVGKDTQKKGNDVDRVAATASRMADWAKHAIRRAFRDHEAQNSTPAESNGGSQNNNLVNDEQNNQSRNLGTDVFTALDDGEMMGIGKGTSRHSQSSSSAGNTIEDVDAQLIAQLLHDDENGVSRKGSSSSSSSSAKVSSYRSVTDNDVSGNSSKIDNKDTLGSFKRLPSVQKNSNVLPSAIFTVPTIGATPAAVTTNNENSITSYKTSMGNASSNDKGEIQQASKDDFNDNGNNLFDSIEENITSVPVNYDGVSHLVESKKGEVSTGATLQYPTENKSSSSLSLLPPSMLNDIPIAGEHSAVENPSTIHDLNSLSSNILPNTLELPSSESDGKYDIEEGDNNEGIDDIDALDSYDLATEKLAASEIKNSTSKTIFSDNVDDKNDDENILGLRDDFDRFTDSKIEKNISSDSSLGYTNLRPDRINDNTSAKNLNSRIDDGISSTNIDKKNHTFQPDGYTDLTEDDIDAFEKYEENDRNDRNEQLIESTDHREELSNEELRRLLRDEQAEEGQARRVRNAAARDAESMTEEMKMEVIALLEAFGLPYVIAPYEAEAQCAVLESLGLVDGVVTDDSDAFLFGAKSVYKNIFSDKKFVEAYLAEDIKRELGLHREELVALAYFLGCDYTDGVTGVGIVNALEIVQAFPMRADSGSGSILDIKEGNDNDKDTSNDSIKSNNKIEKSKADPIIGLNKFKEWLEGYDFADLIAKQAPKMKEKKEVEKKKRKKNNGISKDIIGCESEDNDVKRNTNGKDNDISDKAMKTKNSKTARKVIKGQQGEKGDDSGTESDVVSASDSDYEECNNDNDEIDSAANKKSKRTNNDKKNKSKDDIDIVIKTAKIGDSLDSNSIIAASPTTLVLPDLDSRLILFSKAHRSARGRWDLKPNFPDTRVAEAFMNPAANFDPTAFEWPLPKLHRVRNYCREQLGWTEIEMDQQVDTVIQRYASRSQQPRIDSFFMTYHDGNRAAKFRSTRLGAAVEQVTGKRTELSVPGLSTQTAGKRIGTKNTKKSKSKESLAGAGEDEKNGKKKGEKPLSKRRGKKSVSDVTEDIVDVTVPLIPESSSSPIQPSLPSTSAPSLLDEDHRDITEYDSDTAINDTDDDDDDNFFFKSKKNKKIKGKNQNAKKSRIS